MRSVSPAAPAAESAVYLLITSATPLPAAELQRRARLALQEAGLETEAPPEPVALPHPALTKEQRFAILRQAIIQVEEQTRIGTPLTEAEIVAAVRVVYQERADQARAAAS